MDNLHILNLASYNRPEITEDKNREWVNYGADNDCYNRPEMDGEIVQSDALHCI